MTEALTTKEQLLTIAGDICRYEPVVCHNQQGTAVTWTNTQECSPGIGVEVDLTKNANDPMAEIVRADFYIFERRGDSILAVKRSDDPEWFEGDYFQWVAGVFGQYDSTKVFSLSGLAKWANLRQPKKAPSLITPAEFRAAEPTRTLIVSA